MLKELFFVAKLEPNLVYLFMNGASISLAAVESILIVGKANS